MGIVVAAALNIFVFACGFFCGYEVAEARRRWSGSGRGNEDR